MDNRPLLFEVHFGGHFVLISGKTYVGKLDYIEHVRSISYSCLVQLLHDKCNLKNDDEIYHNPTYEKLECGLYRISSDSELRNEINKVRNGCIMTLYLCGPHQTPHEGAFAATDPSSETGDVQPSVQSISLGTRLTPSGPCQGECSRGPSLLDEGNVDQPTLAELVASLELSSEDGDDDEYVPDSVEESSEGSVVGGVSSRTRSRDDGGEREVPFVGSIQLSGHSRRTTAMPFVELDGAPRLP